MTLHTASTTTGTTPVTTAMTYDAADNLTKSDSGAVLAYDAANQLTNSTPATGAATTFSFDAAGQRTAAATGTGSTATTARYGWDQAGRLSKVTPATGDATTYAYDGGGLRASQTMGSVSTAFTWDVSGGLPMLLSDGVTYVYGPGGLPLEQISGTTPTYLSGDSLGSVRLLTDATAAVVGAYGYSPYGTPTRTGSVTSKLGFAGEYTDSTGLVYLRARYYDPTTSQFLSRDPLEAITGQPYAYAANSPLNRTDPTGAISVGAGIDRLINSGGGKAVTEAIVGFGNGATFGLTGWISNMMSPGAMCTVDTSSGWYRGGELTGTVIGVAVPGGGAVRAGGTAVRTTQALKVASAPNKFHDLASLPRVGSGLKGDAHHRAASFATDLPGMVQFKNVAGDGTPYVLYQVPGGLNGLAGRFEWVVRGVGEDAVITHQRFIPGGTINGLVNAP